MDVRPATAEDTAAIAHLWRERMVILAQSDPRFKAHLQRQPEWQASLFDGTYAHLAVAQKEDAIIGYIGVQMRHNITDATDAAVITDIALDAHTYHSGLGAALLASVTAWMQTQAVDTLLVLAPRYHPVEQAFWRSKKAQEWTNTQWKIPPEYVWMKL